MIGRGLFFSSPLIIIVLSNDAFVYSFFKVPWQFVQFPHSENIGFVARIPPFDFVGSNGISHLLTILTHIATYTHTHTHTHTHIIILCIYTKKGCFDPGRIISYSFIA